MMLFLLQDLTPWNMHTIKVVSLLPSSGLSWFHPLLLGHNMIIMWSRGLKFRSLSHDYQGFQVLSPHRAHSACSASESTIPSLTVQRIHTRSPRSPLTDFGAISSEATTPVSCTTKTVFFRISVWTVMLWLGCHVLKRPLIAFEMLLFCPL